MLRRTAGSTASARPGATTNASASPRKSRRLIECLDMFNLFSYCSRASRQSLVVNADLCYRKGGLVGTERAAVREQVMNVHVPPTNCGAK